MFGLLPGGEDIGYFFLALARLAAGVGIGANLGTGHLGQGKVAEKFSLGRHPQRAGDGFVVEKGQKDYVPIEPLGFVHGDQGELAGAGVERVGVFGFDGGEALGANDVLQHGDRSGQSVILANLLADAHGEFVGGG